MDLVTSRKNSFKSSDSDKKRKPSQLPKRKDEKEVKEEVKGTSDVTPDLDTVQTGKKGWNILRA